jgi:polyisoprenoid-binding protein YceI
MQVTHTKIINQKKQSLMKKILFLVAVVLFQVTAFAQDVWKSDKAHSQLTFSIVHKGLSDVMGLFKDFSTTITSAKPDFSDAVIEMTADVASINTGVEMRDNHLKTPDFFDATAFPTLTFKSKSLQKTGTDKYTLTGDLTLHGVTKPVTMNLWYRGTSTNPQNNKMTSGFQLTGTIKRSDFNIGAKFPAAMLTDEVAIKADGEFNKQ